MNRKTLGWIVLALLLIFAAILLHRSTRPPSSTVQDLASPILPAQTKATPARRPISPANQVLAQPVSQTTKPADQRSECFEVWNKIAQENLDQWIEKVSAGKIETSEACRAAEAKAFPLTSAVFDSDECRKTKAWLAAQRKKKASETFTDRCLMNAMLYRAQVIDALTEGFADLSRLEASALMNKMWVRAYQAKFTEADQATNLALADALIEKEPNLYGAHKFKVMVRALDVAQSKDASEAQLDALKDAVAECEAFGVKDQELVEAKILGYASVDRERYADFLKQELVKDPQSPTLQYYSAALQWKNQDRQAAMAIMRGLVARYPNDTRYRETLAKLATSKPGEKAFSTQLSFKFDQL